MADTEPQQKNSSCLVDQRVKIPSGNLSLAGNLTVISSRAPLLILAHGFGGDMDEKGLFTEARDFFAGTGFSVLRFDFRGCGRSEGLFQNVRFGDLAKDFSNVIKYARSRNDVRPTSVGVVCFSLAAGLAILAKADRVGGYAFWSPAVYTDRDMAPRYRSPEIAREIAQQGWFTKGELRVGRSFLDDLAGQQIERSLEKFQHPVLVVHGTADDRIPWGSSLKLIGRLPSTSNLISIPGADHSFRRERKHREWVFSATASWFKGRLRRDKTAPDQGRLFEVDGNRDAVLRSAQP